MAQQARGRARREAIVAAAADLLAREGVDALTHRAAAREAGVPLGSTTYYFADRDELVAAALDAWLTEEEARIAALVVAVPRRRRGPQATAELVVEVLVGRQRAEDAAALARFYARFVEIGRIRSHRSRIARSRAAYDASLAEALDRCGLDGATADLALVTAATDGSLLNALIDGHPDPWSSAVATVARALDSGSGVRSR